MNEENNFVSPKYIMKLIDKVIDSLWNEFPTSKYKKVLSYINRWHISNDDNNFNDYWENFNIIYQDNSKSIDLAATINTMPDEIILKIAIDLGIETPDFISSIPTFKNDLKESYNTAFQSFEKALKQVEENPDIAIGLANSTLESIIKHILISLNLERKGTLYKLTENVLKEFKLFPNKEAQEEIKIIGSGLLNVSKNIEKLRSYKTSAHGRLKDEYIINDSLYAYFIINSVSTIGIYLISFYNKKYKKNDKNKIEENNKATYDISVEDIPF